jgi:hypothetical protein
VLPDAASLQIICERGVAMADALSPLAIGTEQIACISQRQQAIRS